MATVALLSADLIIYVFQTLRGTLMDKLIAYVQHVYISDILHVTEKICLWGKSSLHMSKWAVQFILIQFNLTYSAWQNEILCQSAISTKTKQRLSKQGLSLLCTFIKNQRWQTDECFSIQKRAEYQLQYIYKNVRGGCLHKSIRHNASVSWGVGRVLRCFDWFLAQWYVVLEAQING